MERAEWLKACRQRNETRMDTLISSIYDENWGGYINETHLHMLNRLLDASPVGGSVLDAACGTGKYWPVLLERGLTIVGIDQSRGMLQQAQGKHPEVTVRHMGMQELDFVDEFDGIICLDAMENVFPEDWPRILANFARALHPYGFLYFTVELESEENLRHAYEEGKKSRLPLAYGEHGHEGYYHYYPSDEQVCNWFTEAGFSLLSTDEGDGYLHYLVSRQH